MGKWRFSSSFKKLAKTMTNGIFRVSSTAGITGSKKRQFRGHIHLNGSEIVTDLIGTRSSTEMINKQNIVLNVKKSNIAGLAKDGSFGQALDSVKELSSNVHHKKPGASYHNMKTAKTGSCQVSAYASDFCIVEKTKPAITVSFSGSSSDDADANVSDLDRRSNSISQYDIGSQVPIPSPEDGERVGGTVYNSSNREITRDGLRELDKMIKEQSRSRSERLTLRRNDDSLSGVTHDVSSDTMSSESKVSMEACINLSEEL